MAVGISDGSSFILQKGEGERWFKTLQFSHNDKPILDYALIDTSLVVSSENRKLSLVNLQTGALECQELVDRTYVSSIMKF